MMSAAIALGLLMASPAWAGSGFGASEIREGILEFYGWVESGEVETRDLRTAAGALAEMAVSLKPAAYNELLGALVNEFRTHPEHRRASWLVIRELDAAIEPLLAREKRARPEILVLNDALLLWSLALPYTFAEGAWATRPEGLAGIERFRRIVVVSARRYTWARQFKFIGTGAALGLADSALRYVREKRLDPSDAIQAAARDILRAHAARLAEVREGLEQGGAPCLVGASVAFGAAETCLDERGVELAAIEAELTELAALEPWLAASMDPALEDLSRARSALESRRAELALGE